VVGGSVAALAETLYEAHRRARKIKFGAQLIFEEALVAEMQRGLLVGEKKECGRRRFCLRDVVDAHRASLGRAAALQIDIFLEPAIEVRRRDAALAGQRDLIDQRKKFLGALAGFGASAGAQL